MSLGPERYRLSESDNQRIFEASVRPDLFDGNKSSGRPVAIVLGGQPGAGKSKVFEHAIRELEPRGGAVRIDCDALREYHPAHRRLVRQDDKTAGYYTNHDAGRWVEKALAYAQERKVNIVLEGTMRNSDEVASTVQGLRSAGYEIEIRALAVNDRLSRQGILARYEDQRARLGHGRLTPPEVHQSGYDGMPLTLERVEREKLADRVVVYRRGGDEIYRNELRDGQWTREPSGRRAVEQERQRSMTLQERVSYSEGYERLNLLINLPERLANAEEKNEMEVLRRQARRELLAEVFRREPAEQALAQYPELGQAYEYLKALEAQVNSAKVGEAQRTAVLTQGRASLAQRIELGQLFTEPRKSLPERMVESRREPERSRRDDGKER